MDERWGTAMDEAQLVLSQWFSPAFPTGAFAYSQGLEQAIADGTVAGPDDLDEWLCDLLMHGSGRADAILIRAAAICEDEDLADLDRTARAFAASAERVVEIEDTGASFGTTVAAAWPIADRALCYPVAIGHACRGLGLPVDATVAQYLLAMVSGIVSAAQRLMPLGQTRAQAIVAGLHPLCQRIAEETHGCGPDDLATASFVADIAAMRHETLQPRIFRS
ncbi:urease accessory protein UreF [Palleronia sp. LCG004]|uniref:urease accessory protein UreF n=1 Tax=Palleronia sp. LCG004 TaxID=3079304 RepID=UPI002943CC1E|nr:urease accessory UreF family protein [Palleronia sp. LCG004]WOI55729.1 urease accessory UreF family protein [Palleronia sp. LCG004]